MEVLLELNGRLGSLFVSNPDLCSQQTDVLMYVLRMCRVKCLCMKVEVNQIAALLPSGSYSPLPPVAMTVRDTCPILT